MSTEENKQVVIRFVQEALLEVAGGNLEHIREFLTPDVVYHNPLTPPSDDHHDRLHNEATAYGAALADLEVEIDHIIAEGDLVAVHQRFSGRHHQSFPHAAGALEPTGEGLSAGGLALYRIRDGKIAEVWFYTNLYDALRAGAIV